MPPHVLQSADKDALARELEPLFGHDLATPAPITMKQVGALRAYDATRRLGELAPIPTLVVACAHDPIARVELGRALAAGVPEARYVEISDAAHGVPIQEAERINALLADHFEAAQASAASPLCSSRSGTVRRLAVLP